jgi:hypothetical protein
MVDQPKWWLVAVTIHKMASVQIDRLEHSWSRIHGLIFLTWLRSVCVNNFAGFLDFLVPRKDAPKWWTAMNMCKCVTMMCHDSPRKNSMDFPWDFANHLASKHWVIPSGSLVYGLVWSFTRGFFWTTAFICADVVVLGEKRHRGCLSHWQK